jgi:hemoglobin/transferrin/lactoferrin receptor protein
MLCGNRSGYALLLGVSSLALMAGGTLGPVHAQEAITLDPITVLATKTPESVWDSLSATSAVQQDQINQIQPRRIEDVLISVPGVWFQQRSDSPETALSIRGLQDFGRVAVLIDGARQNFQRTGHSANGTFLIDPELLAGVDIVRGPVANVYGSGAIGGVASFRTKDVDDILRPGETWGTQWRGQLSSNPGNPLGSVFGAARTGNVDIIVGGAARDNRDYKDGNGDTVANSGFDMQSGLAKIAVRPADGHQIKLTGIVQNSTFDTGQAAFGESTYDSQIRNDIIAARWTYARPDDRIFDFDANVYWTKTATDQTKTSGTAPPIGIGNVGDSRDFTIDTYGADIHNTSRFDFGPVRNAITVGIDGFKDEVETKGFGVVFTPSGERTVNGGFVQWKANYSTWLEVIGALRYDRYELNGGGVSTSGDRVSPKITVGITPIAGITPYVTYAEGYRAPAVTETLVSGIHPVMFAPFEFIPNPTLKPEIGKTLEGGINFKFNNVFAANDAFRAKASVFRNNVEDYIDQAVVPDGFIGAGGIACNNPNPFLPICIQYQNLAEARLEGIELEAAYDAGTWFAHVGASHIRGRDLGTNQPLGNVPPDKVSVTVGARFLDRKLTTAVRWIGVAAKEADDIPDADGNGVPDFTPVGGYGVVNFYAGYDVNRDVRLTFAVENLFDKQYVPYLNASANTTFPMPGITVKGGIQIHFGDEFFKKG